MKRALPLTILLIAAPALAQQGPTERVKAFASLPNWTGLWETDISAALASGSLGPPPASDASQPPGPGAVTSAEAAFLGRMQLMHKPPYKPEWEAKDVAARKKLLATPPALTAKLCAMGFPTILESPTPDGMFQAMVTPEETLFLFRTGEVRHIYTDGRPHPRSDDRWPTAMGDSIGHWEGTTLVIDTIARTPGSIAPGGVWVAADLSAEAHFTERLRMIDADTMQNDLTIEDPERFTQPWKVSVRYERVKDVDRMIAVNCDENDRNPVVDGHLTISAP